MIDRPFRSSNKQSSHAQILAPPIQFVRFDRAHWLPGWPRIPPGGSGAATAGPGAVNDPVCLLRCPAPVIRSVSIVTALVSGGGDVNDQHSIMEHFLWEEIGSYNVPVLLRDEDERFVSKTMLEMILCQNLFTLFNLDKPIEAFKPTNAELILLRKINEFHMGGQLVRLAPFERWNDQLIPLESLLDRYVTNPLSPSESSRLAASNTTGWVQINNVFVPFVKSKSFSVHELVNGSGPASDEIPFAPVTNGMFVPLDILLDCPVLSDRSLEQIIRSVSVQASGNDLHELNRLISEARLSSELLKPGARLVQISQLMACLPRLFVRFLPSHNPRQYVSRRFSEAALFNGGILRTSTKFYSPFIYTLRWTKIHGDWINLNLLSPEHIWFPCSVWNCSSAASRAAKPTETEYFELLSAYFSGVLKPARVNEKLISAKTLASIDRRLHDASVMFLEVFQQRQKETLLKNLCKTSASRSDNPRARPVIAHCASVAQPETTSSAHPQNERQRQDKQQEPTAIVSIKPNNSAVLLKNPAVRLCKEPGGGGTRLHSGTSAAAAASHPERIELVPVNIRGKKLLSVCSQNRQKVPLAELKDMFFPDISTELLDVLCSQHLAHFSAQEMNVLERFKIDRNNDQCVHLEDVGQVLQQVVQGLRLRSGGQQASKTAAASTGETRGGRRKQRRNAASDAERKIRMTLMCDQSSDDDDDDDQPRRCTRSRIELRRYNDLSSTDDDEQANGEGTTECRRRHLPKRKA